MIDSTTSGARGPFRALFLVAILLAAPSSTARAQEAGRPLRVGTKVAPPFVMKDPDGGFSGISVDLWTALAGELGVEWRFEERPLTELFTGLTDGSLDVAISALTITSEREKIADFTHPYFLSGLGIAVARRGEGGWLATGRRMFSGAFLKIVGLLLVLLVGSGVLVWIFERRKNQEHFGGGVVRGLGSGFWWSAVTMTTVGYGDKAPVTLAGRLVGLVWMFACVVFLSGLTAAIASALTVSSLEYAVQGPEDLPRARVATAAGTTSAAYLTSRGIPFTPCESATEALEKLANGEADAVVYDKPLLEWFVRQRFAEHLHVLPTSFRHESYAIAVPSGSELEERLNVRIPAFLSSQEWSDILSRHLGR